MGLIVIKDRVLGVVEYVTADEGSYQGTLLHLMQEPVEFYQGGRYYRMIGVAGIGNRAAIRYFINELEETKNYNQAWLNWLAAINFDTLVNVQLLFIAERSTPSYQRIKFPVAFKAFFKPVERGYQTIVQNNGATNNAVYISDNGTEFNPKTPLDKITFLESIKL